ncbi:MAG: hypothetical protein WC400_01540 [Patescibacteria group bacterium]|jgi:hypothetical protein
MKNRLVAVRGIVVDIIQIGLRLVFSIALIWAIAMLLGAMSPMNTWEGLWWVVGLIFVILTVRSNLSEIGRRFKEKKGWLTVTFKSNGAIDNEVYPIFRWVLGCCIILAIVCTAGHNPTGMLSGQLALSGARMEQSEAVYILEDVTYFNPGVPDRWDDAGRIVVSGYSDLLQTEVSAHGLVSATVSLSAKPFSTELISRHKLPLDLKDEVRNAIIGRSGETANWRWTWSPVELNRRFIQNHQIVAEFDRSIARKITAQDDELSSSIGNIFSEYLASTERSHLSVNELKRYLTNDLVNHGWAIQSLSITPKTNNWH